MPKFICSYAHDIACYADFVVEAKNQKAAQRIINQALRDWKFANTDTTPCWENGATNKRVFVQGLAPKEATDSTLEELTGDQHLFSPHTHLCTRCGKHADDDLGGKHTLPDLVIEIRPANQLNERRTIWD